MKKNTAGVFDVNHFEQALRDLLQQEATHAPVPTITAAQVATRARTIRRRRRGLELMAVAATFACIAGLIGTWQPNHDRPVQPTDDGHAPTVKTLNTNDLTVGAGPLLPVLHGDNAVAADGRQITVGQSVIGLAVVDGLVVTGADNGQTMTMTVRDMSGNKLGSYPAASGPVASPDASSVFWSTANGQVMQLQGPGTEPSPFGQPTQRATEIVTVDSGCNATADQSHCSVYLNASDATTAYRVSEGATETVPSYSQVLAASPSGRLAVDVRVDEDQPCSAIVAQDQVQKRTCDYRLGQFSPSGSALLGFDPLADGMGHRTVSVLRSNDLGPQVTWKLKTGGITQIAWEDDAHLLAVVMNEDFTMQLIRLSMDGSAELSPLPFEKGNYDLVLIGQGQ